MKLGKRFIRFTVVFFSYFCMYLKILYNFKF